VKRGGAASVPALSPLSANDAFSSIEATFASVGLKVTPYHASIPSLGQMSFLLLGRDHPPPSSLLPSGTRYLDDAALAELFAKPRDVASRPASPALLHDQSVVRGFWAAR
jgi:spermidine synthase